MVMRGLGQGVLKESREQARVIRNAARYLTGEAKAGSIQTTSNDNRRTYNNSVNSTIQVQQMVVRDEQDIRALAVEIATLTRRQQRGKGTADGVKLDLDFPADESDRYDTQIRQEDEDMSHFSVAVFSQTPGDVEALLASI